MQISTPTYIPEIVNLVVNLLSLETLERYTSQKCNMYPEFLCINFP